MSGYRLFKDPPRNGPTFRRRMRPMRITGFFGLTFVLGASMIAGCAVTADETPASASAVSEKPEPSDVPTTGDRELDIGSGEEISLDQNTSWTVDMGAAKTVRIVAYGDSI